MNNNEDPTCFGRIFGFDIMNNSFVWYDDPQRLYSYSKRQKFVLVCCIVNHFFNHVIFSLWLKICIMSREFDNNKHRLASQLREIDGN